MTRKPELILTSAEDHEKDAKQAGFGFLPKPLGLQEWADDPSRNGQNIILVDNDEEAIRLISVLLEFNSAKVTGFTSAAAVIEALANTKDDDDPIDVVVSDESLGDAPDGLELLKQIDAFFADWANAPNS